MKFHYFANQRHIWWIYSIWRLIKMPRSATDIWQESYLMERVDALPTHGATSQSDWRLCKRVDESHWWTIFRLPTGEPVLIYRHTLYPAYKLIIRKRCNCMKAVNIKLVAETCMHVCFCYQGPFCVNERFVIVKIYFRLLPSLGSRLLFEL